jgi:hypothetical protein
MHPPWRGRPPLQHRPLATPSQSRPQPRRPHLPNPRAPLHRLREHRPPHRTQQPTPRSVLGRHQPRLRLRPLQLRRRQPRPGRQQPPTPRTAPGDHLGARTAHSAAARAALRVRTATPPNSAAPRSPATGDLLNRSALLAHERDESAFRGEIFLEAAGCEPLAPKKGPMSAQQGGAPRRGRSRGRRAGQERAAVHADPDREKVGERAPIASSARMPAEPSGLMTTIRQSPFPPAATAAVVAVAFGD